MGINPVSAKIPGIGTESTSIGGVAKTSNAAPSEFMQTLEKTMQQVESLQTGAENQVQGVMSGAGTDVHSAMIAVEKANLSFQLMMQVRNKIVQAYEEISRMPF